MGGADGPAGVRGPSGARGAGAAGGVRPGSDAPVNELMFGIPTGTPSIDPASLRRLWVLDTKALGSAADERSLVVSAIRGPIPPPMPESPGKPEPGIPKPVGIPRPEGMPRPEGSAEASGRAPGIAEGSASPKLGSGAIGGYWKSVGAGCEGAAAAAPIPDPNAASAKPEHASAPTISRPDIEIASIVFPLVEYPLATRITLITVVENSLIRNTTRSRFAHNEMGGMWRNLVPSGQLCWQRLADRMHNWPLGDSIAGRRYLDGADR
jgi:hypothetical protein